MEISMHVCICVYINLNICIVFLAFSTERAYNNIISLAAISWVLISKHSSSLKWMREWGEAEEGKLNMVWTVGLMVQCHSGCLGVIPSSTLNFTFLLVFRQAAGDGISIWVNDNHGRDLDWVPGCQLLSFPAQAVGIIFCLCLSKS